MEKSFIPNEYEIEVLRMLNKELELEWGAWVAACLGFLCEEGFCTNTFQITEKGKAFLKSLDKPID